MKHASVKIDGMRIPLIGVAVSATDQECDCCGRAVHISEAHVTINGKVCCEKCFIEQAFMDGEPSQ